MYWNLETEAAVWDTHVNSSRTRRYQQSNKMYIIENN